MNGEVYLTGGRCVQDIAYHYPYLAGLPGATDYPVHCAAGQNAVPTIGLVAYVGRELCADEAKEQTKEKLYLTFGCGAWVNAAKAGTSKRNSCLCRVLHFPRRNQAVSRMATALLLADLFLFPVKDFLLHGCEVAGDRTEIGAYHLVSHFGVYLCGADMLVTEYL